MPDRAALPLRTAPVIHLALVASSLIVVGVFWFLRGGVPIALLPASRRVLSYTGYGAVLLLAAAATLLKNRVTALSRGDDAGAWWSANGTRILGLWLLGDLGCVLGAVLWFLTDNQMVLLSLGGAGLLILASYRPSKVFTYM
jgi:hypothetical protein